MSENTMKTEFLIHDLKIPIAVIDTGAKSLLSRQDNYGPLTQKQIKVLKRILRNTLTTKRLVNDVLELGKSRQGIVSTRDFTIGALIYHVLIEIFDLLDTRVSERMAAIRDYEGVKAALEDSGTKLFLDPLDWETTVHMDVAKVSQIFRNLLSNAFKHRRSVVEIHGHIEENHLVLKVKDDGKGIPEKDHTRIFDTYFTTGSAFENTVKSHGLGLAGVMALLKDMGGKLVLESGDGQGTAFIVRMPLGA